MHFADTVRASIRGIYCLSPYCWADTLLKRQESRYPEATNEQKYWRNARLQLSERYIVYWFFLAIALFLLSPLLPGWVAPLLLLRVLGILNKELGVILFGICKITEGRMVATSGRAIVLALVNFLSAVFLFATIYALAADFQNLPAYTLEPLPFWALIQAANIQFTLSTAFEPANLVSWWLCLIQSGFCFMFGTLVISMFVSLLNIRPLEN